MKLLKGAILLLSLSLLAFKVGNPPTQYHLILTPAQVQALGYALDKSEAEHTVITQLQQVIYSQVQMQDKAATDTTHPKH